jgi:hypothetical protein
MANIPDLIYCASGNKMEIYTMNPPTLFDLPEMVMPVATTPTIDAIFTTRPDDPAAWAATDAGMLIGCISTDGRLYDTSRYGWSFKIQFIDNEFKAYNHTEHVRAVAAIRPKYATVRDIMTREQCAAARIDYYDFEQILDFVAELEDVTRDENGQPQTKIIIIPKWDCLDRIPERYVLGYSVETAYGRTPLPECMFRGRPVHLLGGSWKKQLACLRELPGDVVSIDNNHIQLIAQKGDYVTPTGERVTLSRRGFGWVPNHRQTCLTISFGAIRAKLAEIATLQIGVPR